MEAKEDHHSTIHIMAELETGVLKNSKNIFHLPSEFAMENLFFAPYIGHFFCDTFYKVQRDTFDYFLFIFIDEGSLRVSFAGKEYTARAQDCVLIDCGKPHAYFAGEKLSFRFFHFHGAASSRLYDRIVSRQGHVFRPSESLLIENALNTILVYAADGYHNEAKISAQVHVILSELATQSAPTPEILAAAVTKAIKYIEKHFTKDLAVKRIAEEVYLSECYFSRIFKKYTNISPHEYIIKLRVTFARQLLASTDNSIELICDACGFNSAQHFSRCFRQYFNITPSQYRKLTRSGG
ncbi:MAG: AraC family transcriptional regulator [Treponema sp.]|jgi:AraC-like DNA-binding protein|nr:AraC family transcriptional regulator [Treponema sp.]